MKRVVLSGAALLTAFVLPGCPIYPEERGCFSDADCHSGELCHVNGYCVGTGSGGRGGSPSLPQCDEPSDCKVNQTCGKDARCHVGSCGIDSTGCVRGFECVTLDGVHTCVRQGGTGGAGGASGSGGSDAAVDSSPPDSSPAGSGGTGTDAGDSAMDDASDDGATDSASDAPADSANDAPRDSANDAPRDSASDAPRG